jgi:hypothetical protein
LLTAMGAQSNRLRVVIRWRDTPTSSTLMWLADAKPSRG